MISKNINEIFTMNKNFFYKLKLERKKPKVGGISDFLQSVASPTYILASDSDIEDLRLIRAEEDVYVSGKEQDENKLLSFQGLQIYQQTSDKPKSIEVPWICKDGETRYLDVVYFSDSVEGLFLKVQSPAGFVLKRVLDKDGYTLEDSN